MISHKRHIRELLIPFCAFCGLFLFSHLAIAEVVRVDIQHRNNEGTYERLEGRVYFKIDPKLPANRGIADIDFAPVNKDGMVEFSSDLLFFKPKKPRGTAFLEVVNRGGEQSLSIMGDGFQLEQGFALAFLGWQFDVQPAQGLTFQAPTADVEGLVRDAHIQQGSSTTSAFRLTYCAFAEKQSDARVTLRTSMDQPPQTLPHSSWDFIQNGCAIALHGDLKTGLYEVVYTAKGSPVAGLGLAAIRDFASYLKHGPNTLSDGAQAKVIGYGYSQSGRFLREFVRDGFNVDERGRIAFDGLMIASAGAGGGSFNHRFAMPGQAGNSVLSVLRPVDLPPFTDEPLLTKARASGVVPKIFYTFSSTEYWARAGSLTHTTEDGVMDVPLAPTSRLYLIAGTPHASGPLPPTRGRGQFQQYLNFAEQRWVQRALLLDLDAWVRRDTAPPPSRYPTIASGDLVPLGSVEFPHAPSIPFPDYMPSVWRMDYGTDFNTKRVITNEPPVIGAPFRILVPQVNADGNDLGGIRIPEIAVPLGTYTGWNVALPQLRDLRYLSGLTGSFDPFPASRADRVRTGDSRRSIAERYAGREDYVRQVTRAAEALVRERFMLESDVPAAVHYGEEIWDAVAAIKR